MKHERFDSVEMKRRIQAKLLAEWEGLSDEQVRQRIRHRLSSSDDPVAQWWRQVGDAEALRAKHPSNAAGTAAKD